MTSVDSRFDNRFNHAFGNPKDFIADKMKDVLPNKIQDFISQSPFLVMATSNSDGWCDASPKGGKPGFVKIVDDTHLFIPDIAGNKLFQGYLNMMDNPHVGIVFFIPGCPDVARVNGRVTILNAEEVKQLGVEAVVNNPDDRAVVLQGIMVEVEEAYGHCPRALNFGEVWDIEQIRSNGNAQRIVNPGHRLEETNAL